MYQGFYGLRELPFELTPNPRYLYLTQPHREALSNLQYGLAAAKPVTVLIGEAGTGKTTLLKAALESSACRHVRALHVTNPTLTRAEFVQTLARGFGLPPEAAASKAVLLDELERLLPERRAHGEITALIIDEAQSLNRELLEEVRLLGNIESATEKYLPLVLVGQPELGERLEQSDLRQLKQRVSLRCEIRPFDIDETAAYLFTRVAAAGGSAAELFTREAVALIHEHSRGIPRTISVICDNSLATGLALGRRPIDREIVAEVANDFWLGRQKNTAATGRRELPTTTALAADPPEPATGNPTASSPVNDSPTNAPRPPQRLFTRLITGRFSGSSLTSRDGELALFRRR